jgi:hypothetical protein
VGLDSYLSLKRQDYGGARLRNKGMINMSKGKFDWNEIFQRLDCEKYNPKGKTFEEGLHCYTIIVHYLNLLGYNFNFNKHIIGDLTQDNINEKWKEDPARVVNLCLEYFSSISREVPITQMKLGDVLIVQINKNIIPTIYCGGNKIFTMLEQGTVRLNLNKFKILSCHRVDKNE